MWCTVHDMRSAIRTSPSVLVKLKGYKAVLVQRQTAMINVGNVLETPSDLC